MTYAEIDALAEEILIEVIEDVNKIAPEACRDSRPAATGTNFKLGHTGLGYRTLAPDFGRRSAAADS
jgi:hypothetical protein